MASLCAHGCCFAHCRLQNAVFLTVALELVLFSFGIVGQAHVKVAMLGRLILNSMMRYSLLSWYRLCHLSGNSGDRGKKGDMEQR